MSAAPLAGALRLVVILDAEAAQGRDLAAIGAAAARGGATMLQVRDKTEGAAALADLARRVLATASVPVVVNDRLDVALAVGAAGCHLGQEDFPIGEARRLAPAGFLLGGSAGDADEVRRAAAQQPHYLGIGPVRASPGKADAGAPIGVEGFRRLRALVPTLPAVAIGGITAADAPALIRAGAAGIAVISAVLAADDPERAARELREAVEG